MARKTITKKSVTTSTKGRRKKTEDPNEYRYRVHLEDLDKKLDKLTPEALKFILRIMLIELLVLEDTGLQFQSVGRKQAEQFLDNNIRWLSAFDLALEKLFSGPLHPFGAEEARDGSTISDGAMSGISA